MSSQFQPSVEQGKTLFERMAAKGQLLPKSKQLIVSNLDGAMVAVVAGAAAENIGVEDPITVLIVLDYSASMSSVTDETKKGLRKVVRVGQKSQKQFGVVIIIGIITFGVAGNIKPLLPFTPVDKIDLKVIDGYDPDDGGTALYDGTFFGLTGSAGYGFALFDKGIRGGRKIMVDITDGGENDSKRIQNHNIGDLSALMADLRRPKNSVFALLGLGADSDYRPVARLMGFLDKNVKAISATEGGIAHALELVSQSIEFHSKSQSQGQPMTSAGDDEASAFPEPDQDDSASTFFS